MEELLVRSATDLADDGRLQIHEDGSGDVLARSGLGKERREILIVHSFWNGSVGIDPVLQAVQLPARIANLATGLEETVEDIVWTSLLGISLVVLVITWPTWMEITSRMIS